jgi:hypothetical protein
MLNDIRGSKGYDIGSGSNATSFSAISTGYYQGTALRLYTTVISSNQALNMNNYTYYYFDTTHVATGDGVLLRLASGASAPSVVASNLLGPLYFTSETYLGNTQTVRTYKGVIHTVLQFSQFQYPLTPVGTNGLYDYYRIDCRATPHLPDGP